MCVSFFDVVSLIGDVISNLSIRNSRECKVLYRAALGKVTSHAVASIVDCADSDNLLIVASIDHGCGDSKTDQAAW